MASISTDKTGARRIQFVAPDRVRKSIRLGRCSKREAESVKLRVEFLLSAQMVGGSIDRETSNWLSSIDPRLRHKIERSGLIEPSVELASKKNPLMSSFLDDYVERHGETKKPATRIVWGQVISSLIKHMPEGIRLNEVTVGHAKKFVDDLRSRGLASTTIHKRTGIARQFFQDAVDWGLIDSNPFRSVKTQSSSAKSNVEVAREKIEAILNHCDIHWKTIIALSRYGGLRCPSEVLSLRWIDVDLVRGRMNIQEPKVEHHEGRGVRQCPIFPELREILEEAWDCAREGAEYVVDKPTYRKAALGAGGWANANLRTQFLRILDLAGVSPWKRLFHSMRASRQTELERCHPLHIVCAWLGNSEAVAKRSYLLVTDADFESASKGIADTQPKPKRKKPVTISWKSVTLVPNCFSSLSFSEPAELSS